VPSSDSQLPPIFQYRHLMESNLPIVMAPANKDTLVACLQGQELRVPDLWPPFANWPVGRSAYYKTLIPSVDAFLESVIQEPKKLEALKNDDFGLFISCWWPHADLHRLRVMGAMIAWLFLWDDELDLPMSSLGDDLEAGQEYVHQTLLFVEQCLGLNNEKESFTPDNCLISSFHVIGDILRDAYTIEQRQFFMKELDFYCNMCAVERNIHTNLDSQIPTLEEFWSYRKGSDAAIVVYAMSDYAYESDTFHVLKTSNGRLFLDKLTIIISITNDIFSLKKEFDHDRIESLIPFLVATHGNPQQAMDEAVLLLFSTIEEFEAVAKNLVSEANMVGGDLESVQKAIGAAQYMCTGHLTWSYATKRYSLPKNQDGTLTLLL